MKVIAKTYREGKMLQCVIFDNYAEARRWAIAATGVKGTVCTANNTAVAAHEPGELPRWKIEPAS